MEFRKIIKESVRDDNYKVFSLLSHYLNHAPDYITKEEMDEILKFDVSIKYAFTVILAAAFELDIDDNPKDRDLFQNYFKHMIHKLDTQDYYNNPYYKNIKIPTIKIGNSELKYEKYKPFEGFIYNDIVLADEGRQIPQIGFFEDEFKFPAILEDDRIWMTITPNEIETMKVAVDKAFGNVLTFGLGLGYYPYMVSEKDNVKSVTIVEINDDVIQLFKDHILPQFPNAEKVKIIKADAFDYAENHMAKEKYDFVFTDLWHDVSDGIDMYLKMKKYERRCPHSLFEYWIEKSILCYL